jgi:hypothetical protein
MTRTKKKNQNEVKQSERVKKQKKQAPVYILSIRSVDQPDNYRQDSIIASRTNGYVKPYRIVSSAVTVQFKSWVAVGAMISNL